MLTVNTTHSPLVEPDVRISRIRLSRKLSPQAIAGSCATDRSPTRYTKPQPLKCS